MENRPPPSPRPEKQARKERTAPLKPAPVSAQKETVEYTGPPNLIEPSPYQYIHTLGARGQHIERANEEHLQDAGRHYAQHAALLSLLLTPNGPAAVKQESADLADKQAVLATVQPLMQAATSSSCCQDLWRDQEKAPKPHQTGVQPSNSGVGEIGVVRKVTEESQVSEAKQWCEKLRSKGVVAVL
eukprot:CAMPEP_0173405022 /NCGR_PEP_ID=MMETSP1356-20130122/60843_1 /TAXON_ID=77927 ORGANISM="Hemiselmis virescens, Strain PCC157" /NCGR_SAMPLE_ID=MMETSP1356 /ASSEMBLY_ACC=CAM_ASM_000847 /LENGTH=185 /DNA_ID=CAMNT_0014365781 /DNA_START=75 /DNA_END=632 /DNA_ORIENTATION=-